MPHVWLPEFIAYKRDTDGYRKSMEAGSFSAVEIEQWRSRINALLKAVAVENERLDVLLGQETVDPGRVRSIVAEAERRIAEGRSTDI